MKAFRHKLKTMWYVLFSSEWVACTSSRIGVRVFLGASHREATHMHNLMQDTLNHVEHQNQES